MSGLLFVAVIIAAIVLLDVLALRYGVDSRSESQDPRSPVRGITV
ncbi:MAG TPA: hypothetical protein VFP56_02660 [Candidatus Limnocylindrales bacterium]|nr:hypothetical protein [Candidatus Limnocylindrales bacterium]